MALQATNQSPSIVPQLDEEILVVKRRNLFETVPAWQGITTVNTDAVLNTITTKQEFHPRMLMEEDPTYKQIIPYMIFKYHDNYFLMQRKAQASEQRLKNKYTLGIGGHIRKEDITDNSIFNWAKREFEEEVYYNGEVSITILGILNDDSNDVGKVHLGLVLLLTGQHNSITVKSELAHGQLTSLSTCHAYFDQMESWSQLVMDLLKQV